MDTKKEKKSKKEIKTHMVDAAGKSIGRVASGVAALLRGKNSPAFSFNTLPVVRIIVKNISDVGISGKKMDQKNYKRYSGYPGNLKIVSFKSQFEKSPEQTFRKMVERMLPKNKLRKGALKNLRFEK